jgi:hypothetical protein
MVGEFLASAGEGLSAPDRDKGSRLRPPGSGPAASGTAGSALSPADAPSRPQRVGMAAMISQRTYAFAPASQYASEEMTSPPPTVPSARHVW